MPTVRFPAARFPMRQPRKRLLITSTLLIAAVVLVLTVGKAYFSVPGLWSAEAHQVRQIRLVPFETFVHYRVWWGPWLNFFGNIALFFPVGWLAHAWTGSVRKALLAGVAFSCGIEVLQFVLAAGYSDLDDVLFNSLGAFLGAKDREKAREKTRASARARTARESAAASGTPTPSA